MSSCSGVRSTVITSGSAAERGEAQVHQNCMLKESTITGLRSGCIIIGVRTVYQTDR